MWLLNRGTTRIEKHSPHDRAFKSSLQVIYFLSQGLTLNKIQSSQNSTRRNLWMSDDIEFNSSVVITRQSLITTDGRCGPAQAEHTRALFSKKQWRARWSPVICSQDGGREEIMCRLHIDIFNEIDNYWKEKLFSVNVRVTIFIAFPHTIR